MQSLILKSTVMVGFYDDWPDNIVVAIVGVGSRDG